MVLPHHRSIVRKDPEPPNDTAGTPRTVRTAFHYLGISSDPVEIVHVPADLVAGTADLATRMYHGEFSLAGETVMVPGLTPFKVTAPSPAWKTELASFSWLRHIRAADSEVTNALGRALALDWIESEREDTDRHYMPEVAARRIICWLQNASVLGLDQPLESQPEIMRSLVRQVHNLSLNSQRALSETDRLICSAAVVLASLSISALAPTTAKAANHLARELRKQILPDGGHRSRNPAVLVDLMLDLLPLRDAFAARSIMPPDDLMNALDRMAPLLRFFLHGDGGLPAFNGARDPRVNDVSIVLERAGSKARPPVQAPHSGFQRLAAGPTVVIIDTGQPPRRGVYTGALSFELSDGRHRIITNSGDLLSRPAAAATGGDAHATLSVEPVSPTGAFSRLMAQLRGQHRSQRQDVPDTISVARSEADAGTLVEVSHDAFTRSARLAHTRTVFLSADGLDVRGEDVLAPTGKPFAAERAPTFKIRFPLDPALKISRASDGSSVIIVLANRIGWQFSARGAKLSLEEYACGGEQGNLDYATQIVLSGKVRERSVVIWSFKRVSKTVARAVRPAATKDLFTDGE